MGVSGDVPVLGAYPIFYDERRVYFSLKLLSNSPFQKLLTLLLKLQLLSLKHS